MRVTMLLLCLSSLLCWSATLADRDEQISLTDAVKMIRELQKANVEIRRENGDVYKVNEATKSEISELKEANAEIRVENAVIQREYAALQKENAAIQNENAAIGRKNAEVQKENEAMKSKTSELSNIVSHVQMDIVDLQMNVSTSSQQNDRDSGHVGFSVAANQVEEYNAGDTVKFHLVVSDFKPSGTSGGWDPSSNRYTCPVSGHYTFMATLHKAAASEYDDFAADLMHTSGSGDRQLTRLFNFGDTDTAFSSSMHAIVHCAAGDQVWVKALYDNTRLYDDYHRNNFLGFLIKPGPL